MKKMPDLNRAPIGPTDSSAMMLGKQPARSGAIKAANTAQPLPLSDPWAVARAGTATATGPLADRLRGAFQRGC